jgi:hypothetical protein
MRTKYEHYDPVNDHVRGHGLAALNKWRLIDLRLLSETMLTI